MTHPSLALYGEAYARVDTFIKTLLDETGIRYAILIDRKGFILSHCESPWAPRPPEMAGIATLVASNFAATGTLADLLGEDEFTEQIQQGKNGTLYVDAVGTDALLALIFDTSVPLSKVKMHSKQAIRRVSEILTQLKNLPVPQLDDDFSDGALGMLDDLLG
ncbi:roadblock/LC7 domain-containing protein [Deinococcus sp. RM]|uniref:GTPase-activating protein MglB n=1 Tax=Deinococcus sp. RM TaxID=2316359 RepID=UPI000E69A54B|nr:roadblock/LC7 domain-containing protein [Deinococcus sp. RM]RIY15692.1 roadblock/LC7 domain-containing protein [Deinococcus sp. RM]